MPEMVLACRGGSPPGALFGEAHINIRSRVRSYPRPNRVRSYTRFMFDR